MPDPAFERAKVTENVAGATWSSLLNEAAPALTLYCVEQMAYYNAPGWIIFVAEQPTTGTRNIQKHRLFADDADPTAHDHAQDVRDLKTRAP